MSTGASTICSGRVDATEDQRNKVKDIAKAAITDLAAMG